MRWEGHVTGRGIGEVSTAFWWGNVTVRENLEEIAIEGRIILKFVFNIWKGSAD
jgi:hypothetical protein